MVSTLNEWTPEQYEFEPRESHLKRNLAIAAVCIFTVIMVFIAIPRLRWGSNTYSSKEMGFTVTYPEGWDVGEDFGGYTNVMFSKSGEGVITVIPAWEQSYYTLEDFITWENQALGQSGYDNYVVISENYCTVAGIQGYEIQFETWEGGKHYMKKDVLIVRTTTESTGKLSYTIRFMTGYEKYDEVAPMFEDFVKSFEFI